MADSFPYNGSHPVRKGGAKRVPDCKEVFTSLAPGGRSVWPDVTAALDSLLTGNGRDPNHRHSLPPLGPRLAARGKDTVEP